MSAQPEPKDPRIEALDVLVVDEWLIFDCPACHATIKIHERDAAYEIQCPTCGHDFAPVFKRAGAVHEARRTYTERTAQPPRKRVRKPRRHSAAVDHGRRDRSQGKGMTASAEAAPPAPDILRDPGPDGPSRPVLPPPREPVPRRAPEPDDSPLPVRSVSDFERRRVAATVDQRLHPSEKDEEALGAVIESESGGKYKRIRVRTRKKRATESQRNIRFFLLVAVGGMAIIGASVYAASVLYAGRLAGSNRAREDVGMEDANLVSAAPIGEKIGNWKELIQQFVQAETPDQLLKLIRKPERLKDDVMAYYPNGLPSLSVKQHPLNASVYLLPEGFRSGYLVLSNRILPFFLEKTPTHGYRLDWESFVGQGSVPWKDFIEARSGKTARLRAIVSQANYYEGRFADDLKFMSLQLQDAAREHSLYGYVPQADGKFRRLRDLVLTNESERELRRSSGIPGSAAGDELRLILDVRYPSDSENAVQVEVVELVRDSWLIP